MPQLTLQLSALVQTWSDGSLLAEALLFPGIACWHTQPGGVRDLLVRRARNLVKELPPGSLYRYRLAEPPTLGQIAIEIPPLREDVAREQPVTLTLHYVQWRHGGAGGEGTSANPVRPDGVIAFVPALGIEVLAETERALAEQLAPQIRSALTRRKTAAALRDMVLLDNIRQLRVKPLRLSVALPTLKQAALKEREQQGREKSILKEVANDLAQRRSQPIYERETQVERLAQLLTARLPRSVLLVGPSGVGKTAIVQELARRRHALGLQETPLWTTSGSRIIAGMTGFGMWQERCQKLIREATKTGAIVHLGSLVELIEVGKGGGNTQGIAAVLRPAIARGTLLAIAECTAEQLALIEREDPQLLEAFVTLELAEPTPAETRTILAKAVLDRAADRQPNVSAEGLATLDRLHRRYATYSAAPGRPLRFLRNLLEDRGRNATEDVPYSAGEGVPSNEPEITADDVTAAFSHETGLPLFMLDDAVPLDLNATRDWFRQRVMGQPEPVDLVVDLLASVKAGLARGGKPIASLLFIGPTGVGKTEMAKSLAEFLYQDPGRMIRFDMSEFAHPAAVERLIGGAFAAQGLLTQKVRDQPFMVVLLDEFEKAHPSLFDVLLQVLGEGRLTDGAGRVADFTNTVVIMTSNLGAESFRRAAVGFAGTESAAAGTERHFEREVKAFLRPEMFNRLDRIVPFAPLDQSTIASIARREIDRVHRRDGLRLRDVVLKVDDAVVARLAQQGFDPRYGARPLKRSIERELVAPLAERLSRYVGELTIDCQVRMVAGEVQVDATAHPASGQRVTGGGDDVTLYRLSDVVWLRRRTQALERSSTVLRLRNEIFRLRQAQRQARKRQKKRGLAERFVFTPDQARLLAQAELLGRIDELSRDCRQLEDQALGDLYAGQPVAGEAVAAACAALRKRLNDLLFELYQTQEQRKGSLTLAIFGPSHERVFELSRAYEQICVACRVQPGRYWLKMYRKELDGPTLPAAVRTQHELLPVMHLMHRPRQAGDKPTKVLDVYHPPEHLFRAPPEDVIGVGLQISDHRACALLETESGKHEFQRGQGKPDTVNVETSEGRLLNYDPPHDVGRLGSMAAHRLRRTYDLPGEKCRDYLLEEELRIRGRSIDEAVSQATEDYLTQRIWALLE